MNANQTNNGSGDAYSEYAEALKNFKIAERNLRLHQLDECIKNKKIPEVATDLMENLLSAVESLEETVDNQREHIKRLQDMLFHANEMIINNDIEYMKNDDDIQKRIRNIEMAQDNGGFGQYAGEDPGNSPISR